VRVIGGMGCGVRAAVDCNKLHIPSTVLVTERKARSTKYHIMKL
jgi:hypothetical protein